MPSRRCPHCRTISAYESRVQGVRWRFKSDDSRFIRFDSCQNSDCLCAVAVVVNGADETIVDIYPALEDEPDDLLPKGVRIAFAQALKSFNEKIWDGCVLMCRRALQEAMGDLKATGTSLYAQIESLGSANRITPDLKDWAHAGRLAGNLGAHGDEAAKKWNDESDAQEIVEFSTWFFRYVYVLPQQLAERRERLAEAAHATAEPE